MRVDEHPLARVHSVQAELEGPVRPFLLEVRVVIDETGNHGLAAQIDALRVRSRKPGDVLIRTDGDDAISADRDRLSDRETVIDGNDLSVGQDHVGIRLLRVQ